MLGFGIFDDHKNKSRRKEYEGYKYDSGPEVTIDGKSIAYRDPKNAKHVDFSNRNAAMRGPSINKDAYRGEAFDELYKYDHGTIADAMRANDITNLNNEDELIQTLDTIKGRFAGTGPVDETKKGKKDKKKGKAPKFPDYMDPAKPIQLSNKAANAEATITAHSQRFDSPAAETAYDLKDKYALDLKSGLGQRGQGFKSIQSSGWDNGMSQGFADNRKKLIAENLQPGWNQATMGA